MQPEPPALPDAPDDIAAAWAVLIRLYAEQYIAAGRDADASELAQGYWRTCCRLADRHDKGLPPTGRTAKGSAE